MYEWPVIQPQSATQAYTSPGLRACEAFTVDSGGHDVRRAVSSSKPSLAASKIGEWARIR
jgi:hypothetical protein